MNSLLSSKPFDYSRLSILFSELHSWVENGTQWIILFLKGIVWYHLVGFSNIKDFLFVSCSKKLELIS